MTAQTEALQDALNIVIAAAEVRLLHWQAAQSGTIPEDLIDEVYEAAAEPDLYEANQMTEMLNAAINAVRHLEVREEALHLLRVDNG